MRLACALCGLALGIWLGSSWERFAFDDEHRYLAERGAFCRGELSALNASAAQCAARLESVSLSLAASNTDRLAECAGRGLEWPRTRLLAQGEVR